MYTSEKHKTEIVDCLIVAWAVGYDDKMKIKNANLKGPETTGVNIIRNSWGKERNVQC